MKKTIAAFALIASTNALAIAPPIDPNNPHAEPKKVCLDTYKMSDGSKVATCDEIANNEHQHKKLLKNGCADGQVALRVIGDGATIESCMPPGVVQL